MRYFYACIIWWYMYTCPESTEIHTSNVKYVKYACLHSCGACKCAHSNSKHAHEHQYMYMSALLSKFWFNIIHCMKWTIQTNMLSTALYSEMHNTAIVDKCTNKWKLVALRHANCPWIYTSLHKIKWNIRSCSQERHTENVKCKISKGI